MEHEPKPEGARSVTRRWETNVDHHAVEHVARVRVAQGDDLPRHRQDVVGHVPRDLPATLSPLQLQVDLIEFDLLVADRLFLLVGPSRFYRAGILKRLKLRTQLCDSSLELGNLLVARGLNRVPGRHQLFAAAGFGGKLAHHLGARRGVARVFDFPLLQTHARGEDTFVVGSCLELRIILPDAVPVAVNDNFQIVFASSFELLDEGPVIGQDLVVSGFLGIVRKEGHAPGKLPRVVAFNLEAPIVFNINGQVQPALKLRMLVQVLANNPIPVTVEDILRLDLERGICVASRVGVEALHFAGRHRGRPELRLKR